MTKISINTIKEAAKSATELMDTSAPEVKMLLENPNFAIGLCLVLHKEVAELRQQLQDINVSPKQNEQANLQNPAQTTGKSFQTQTKAPEMNQQTEALAQPLPQQNPQAAPREIPRPDQPSATPQAEAQSPFQTAPQETQPAQYRGQNSPKTDEKKELFA